MNTPVSFELTQLLINKNYPIEFISVGEIKEVPLNIPTIAEVVMWIYEKHGIWMWIEKGVNPDNFYPVIQNHINFKYSMKHWKDSISEAYEAGIEYVLKNLI